LTCLCRAKRDKRSALKLMRKLLKKMRFVPDKLVTDDLRSYGAAARDLGTLIAMSADVGATTAQRTHINRPDEGNARCKGSRARGQLSDFCPSTPPTYNVFNVQRHPISAQTHRAFRASAMQTWREATAAA
jgi:transposase-like protein